MIAEFSSSSFFPLYETTSNQLDAVVCIPLTEKKYILKKTRVRNDVMSYDSRYNVEGITALIRVPYFTYNSRRIALRFIDRYVISIYASSKAT